MKAATLLLALAGLLAAGEGAEHRVSLSRKSVRRMLHVRIGEGGEEGVCEGREGRKGGGNGLTEIVNAAGAPPTTALHRGRRGMECVGAGWRGGARRWCALFCCWKVKGSEANAGGYCFIRVVVTSLL